MHTKLTMAKGSLLFAMLWALFSVFSFGQEGLSTLRGTATDASGAVVPGVTVTAREVQTNVVARTVTTDAQGNYEMPALKSGTYQVTATLTGFKTSVVDDVLLQSNQIKRVDITLEVGEVATQITVSAASAAIQTEEGKIASDFKAAEQYASLPIPGNLFSGTYAVLAVLPDVQREPGDWGTPRFAGQGGAQVHMGQDGVKEETMNSQTVNMESVAELKAVVVNNTADYSRVGYFDTITKSGTNDFHFEGSYYHRNSALGARNFFEGEKAQIIYHTFNIAASGPIIKNKTFFYALWNGERVPGHTFHLNNVPTNAMRKGDFSAIGTIIDPTTGQPFPGNTIPDSRITSVAKVVQDTLLPAPNRGDANVPVNNFDWMWNYPNDQFYADVFSVRIDHRLSDKNSLYGRIQTYRPKYVLSSNYPATGWTRLRHSYSWAVTDSHVFSPNLVNSFTFGGNWDGMNDNEMVDGYQPASGADLVQKMGLQGVNKAGISSPGGSPEFYISGYDGIYINPGGYYRSARNFNVADSVTWAKGRHVLKVGGELRTYSNYNEMVSNENYGVFDFNGRFTGDAYADFLLGLPNSSTRLDPLVNRTMTSKELGLFITDTFKVTQKLTLDLGLRWDRFSSTTYDDGLMVNWDPTTGNVIVPQDAMGNISPLYPANINVVAGEVVPDPDSTNFVPRIGVAYRLDDKTVIRGGYGIFNEFLGSLSRVNGGGPFEIAETYTNSVTDGVPFFQMPNPFPTSLVTAEIPSQGITAYPMKTKNGQIHQFNVSVERQIGDIGVRLSYIGSRNRNMNYGIGTNIPEPSLIPFSDDRRPYPQFVDTGVYRTNGAQNYDSMSVAASRRVGWVTFDAHWTWAHGMDNTLNTQNPYASLYWNRDFLASHRVAINSMFQLPFGRGKRYGQNISPAADQIIGGWNITWVAYFQTGQYFSPSFSDADPSNTNSWGGYPDRVCDGNRPADQRSVDSLWFDTSCFVNPPAGRFGNSGANVLEGPGMQTHNVTVGKNFKITERFQFDFMTLIGNIFNHPNFLAPSS
ncbi:MAG: hypothetical protein H6Q06_1405, partial [Acidobacteria bacterium]|nr:hypothetical protein [Acidobacteriota bacterium]